jgi:hypothetical protein
MTSTETELSLAELYRDCPLAKTGSGIPYLHLSDDFISWISIANAGMLNKGNLLCFDYAIRNLPSTNPIIEIGAFCGLSTNLLSHFKQKHGVENQLFSCDRWMFEGAGGNVGDSDISHDEFRTFVRETYIRNVKMFSRSQLPHTIEMLSDDFFAAWSAAATTIDVFGRSTRLGGPISFCYIDGNHLYDFARRDFANTDRFLEPGGFVLFDDSADGSKWEVCRVIEEVKKMENYRLVIKNPNYLFQKIA